MVKTLPSKRTIDKMRRINMPFDTFFTLTPKYKARWIKILEAKKWLTSSQCKELMDTLLEELSNLEETRVCVGCDTEFPPFQNNQVFCDHRCSGRTRQRRYNKKKEVCSAQTV